MPAFEDHDGDDVDNDGNDDDSERGTDGSMGDKNEPDGERFETIL